VRKKRNQTLALLVVQLNQIRDYTTIFELGGASAVYSMFTEICNESAASNDELFDSLIDEGVVEVIINAMQQRIASPSLHHQGCSILVYIADKSKDRSAYMIDTGVIDRVVKTMGEYESDGSLQCICLGILYLLLIFVDDNERVALKAAHVADNVLNAMDHFAGDPRLYTVGCDIIGHCWNPSVDDAEGVFRRAAESVMQGLVSLNDHEDAQHIGRGLLRRLLDPESAMKVIDRAEMQQCKCALCGPVA
jgi:hypothetical protein